MVLLHRLPPQRCVPKDVYADGIRIGGSDVPERLKHNDVGTCPMCGHKVTYKCEGRGHKYLKAWGNYAVFTAKDNVLYVNAVKVKVSWSHIEEPYIDYEYHRRYIFPNTVRRKCAGHGRAGASRR